MNENHKAAAQASKAGQTMFVVYVPDEGEQVFTAEQARIWHGLVMIEATYLDGRRIAQ